MRDCANSLCIFVKTRAEPSNNLTGKDNKAGSNTRQNKKGVLNQQCPPKTSIYGEFLLCGGYELEVISLHKTPTRNKASFSTEPWLKRTDIDQPCFWLVSLEDYSPFRPFKAPPRSTLVNKRVKVSGPVKFHG